MNKVALESEEKCEGEQTMQQDAEIQYHILCSKFTFFGDELLAPC
jgi:hypothetical protein